ncbi:TetR/AcrR family transcriptional regulator [Marinitoga lauensis]|uniref:TetR/AcrR family transcriptional regulator n=1 Tax=Marinitoga lauensis TaxID=2201189 RepID=UPI00140490E8|nr:TetR/AcrR family transcriptional regulator [Marinitoga lauensis]
MARHNYDEEKIQKKKKLIMETAKKIFYEKGYENTSMNEIARELKMAKGTLYLYFSSKKDLFFSLVYEGLKILENIIKNDIKLAKNGLDKILNMGRAYIKFYREYPDYYSFVIKYESEKADLDTTEPLVINSYEKSEEIYDILKLLILKGIDDGSIREDVDITKMSMLLWLQTIGVVQQFELRKKLYENWDEKFPASEILDYYIDFMRKSLKK